MSGSSSSSSSDNDDSAADINEYSRLVDDTSMAPAHARDIGMDEIVSARTATDDAGGALRGAGGDVDWRTEATSTRRLLDGTIDVAYKFRALPRRATYARTALIRVFLIVTLGRDWLPSRTTWGTAQILLGVGVLVSLTILGTSARTIETIQAWSRVYILMAAFVTFLYVGQLSVALLLNSLPPWALGLLFVCVVACFVELYAIYRALPIAGNYSYATPRALLRVAHRELVALLGFADGALNFETAPLPDTISGGTIRARVEAVLESQRAVDAHAAMRLARRSHAQASIRKSRASFRQLVAAENSDSDPDADERVHSRQARHRARVAKADAAAHEEATWVRREIDDHPLVRVARECMEVLHPSADIAAHLAATARDDALTYGSALISSALAVTAEVEEAIEDRRVRVNLSRVLMFTRTTLDVTLRLVGVGDRQASTMRDLVVVIMSLSTLATYASAVSGGKRSGGFGSRRMYGYSLVFYTVGYTAIFVLDRLFGTLTLLGYSGAFAVIVLLVLENMAFAPNMDWTNAGRAKSTASIGTFVNAARYLAAYADASADDPEDTPSRNSLENTTDAERLLLSRLLRYHVHLDVVAFSMPGPADALRGTRGSTGDTQRIRGSRARQRRDGSSRITIVDA